MPHRMTRETELAIPSELGYEQVVMASAAAVARRMGFAPDRIDDLKTAVAEACLNAIEHGNQSDVNRTVNVVLSEQADRLVVNVADQGIGRMPSRAPAPGQGSRHRGWGLFLIQNLMDEVEIVPASLSGNRIRMVMRRSR